MHWNKISKNVTIVKFCLKNIRFLKEIFFVVCFFFNLFGAFLDLFSAGFCFLVLIFLYRQTEFLPYIIPVPLFFWPCPHAVLFYIPVAENCFSADAVFGPDSFRSESTGIHKVCFLYSWDGCCCHISQYSPLYFYIVFHMR